MSTPESIVLNKCKDMLKKLECMGWVRHWDRLSVGLHMNMQGYMQQHGKKGSSDLISFVPLDETMYVIFFEVKRKEGGVQSISQKEFENKFIGFDNVIYQIITDAKQIKFTVENIRKKSTNYGKLDDSAWL